MTATTYTQLNTLMQKYGSNNKCGLKILAFPCNQFHYQEPGNGRDEILNGLKYVRPGNSYVPNFDMFQKSEVNGKNEILLYTWLKKLCPRPDSVVSDSNSVLWQPIKTTDVYWNFEKFLLDHNGKPVSRFAPSVVPMNLENNIEDLIDRCNMEHNNNSDALFRNIRY